MRSFLTCLAVAVPALLSAPLAPGTAAARDLPAGSTTAAIPSSPRPARLGDCDRAMAGDAAASYRLARRYLFGTGGVAKNRHLGIAWLRTAAARGHEDARRLVRLVPSSLGRSEAWCRPGGGSGRGVAAPPAQLVALVEKLAPAYGLDPRLVLAVMRVESNFQVGAVSSKDAGGLMQLIPETADRFDVDDVFDAEDNIRGGMRYLRWLLAYYRGDVTLTLAAYNAGEGAVNRYGGVPPYRETRSYVVQIRRFYDAERHAFDASVAGPSPLLVRQEAENDRGGSGGPRG